MNISNRPIRALYLLLPAGLVAYYLLIVSSFEYVAHISDTMFFYPDSQTYASVADWIWTGSPTTDTINRPFLYPLLIAGPKTILGEYGIWITQFLLWIAAAICLFWSLTRMGFKMWVTITATLIFCGNFTLLLLTLHALSETLVLFLLSLGMVLVAHHGQMTELTFRSVLLLICSLLAVTKPVFLLLVIVALAYACCWFIQVRERQMMSRGIVVMVIALIPLSVQFGIMKTRHDTWAFSKVGQQTANRYAFALLYGSTNHLSLTQARQAVKEYDIADMLSYTIQHPSSAFRVWVTLVRKNLTAGSAVTDIPRPRPVSTSFMKQTNKVYAYIHLAMTIPLAICMFLAWRQKKTALKQTLAILLFPICLVFTTSGLTFWQADRIVAPVVPLWIVLYTITLRALYSGVKGASSKRHSLCLNSIYRQN